MGKQVNYIMDYPHFLQLAQAALDSGCLILRKEFTAEPQIPSSDLSVVTREHCHYFFYLPELANISYVVNTAGMYYPDYGFNSLGLAMIEAGFSKHPSDNARMYIMTGYYDENGQWIVRSEQISKVYDKLARKARKLAEKVI